MTTKKTWKQKYNPEYVQEQFGKKPTIKNAFNLSIAHWKEVEGMPKPVNAKYLGPEIFSDACGLCQYFSDGCYDSEAQYCPLAGEFGVCSPVWDLVYDSLETDLSVEKNYRKFIKAATALRKQIEKEKAKYFAKKKK